MCYSANISKISFFTNLIASIVLFNTKGPDVLKTIAIFFGYIGIVQLYDWILWENQDNDINMIVTKMQMFHVNFEPILLYILVWILNKKMSMSSYLIVIVYSIYAVFYSIKMFDKKYDYTTIEKIDNKDSLVWRWNTNSELYIFFVLSFLVTGYTNFQYPQNIFFTFLTSSTLAFGLFYKNSEAGRYWCKISSYIPLLFVILMRTNLKKYL